MVAWHEYMIHKNSVEKANEFVLRYGNDAFNSARRVMDVAEIRGTDSDRMFWEYVALEIHDLLEGDS
jgi:hypothetical protein